MQCDYQATEKATRRVPKEGDKPLAEASSYHFCFLFCNTTFLAAC
jgi:hypothetical protein